MASEVKLNVGDKIRFVGSIWGRYERGEGVVSQVRGDGLCDIFPYVARAADGAEFGIGNCVGNYEPVGSVEEATRVEVEEGPAATTAPDESDSVNHPAHYTSDPSGVECITITRHRNFNIGNAFKYLWRSGLKKSADKSAREKEVEDLEKAVWYIQDEIKRIRGLA